MIRSMFFALVLVGCGNDFTTGFSTAGADALTPDGGTGGGEADAMAPMGTGGAPAETGGVPSSGGKVGSHAGAGSTGGAASGGSVGSGGAPETGGALVATGGATPVDACVPVTHSNGLGQTWTDCVPLGTYNESQAMKACEASFGSSCAPNADPQSSCRHVGGVGVTIGSQVNQWVYTIQSSSGVHAGDVIEFTSNAFICPNFPGATGTWQ